MEERVCKAEEAEGVASVGADRLEERAGPGVVEGFEDDGLGAALGSVGES